MGISQSQSIDPILNQVSKDGIIQLVKELSGEVSTTINEKTVTITHRVSRLGNDLAADYLIEKLESYDLSVNDNAYSTNGRNVIATQLGSIHPDKIYIISAHYDSVGKHGADDNASGTAAVLEAARILSKYDIENTIIYALWDEEETGLIGSRNFAINAKNKNLDIQAVLNLDMIGYDGNNNKVVDIDVQNIANSIQMKDDLIELTKNELIDLIPLVVNPGTEQSDHDSFWNVGYSSLLIGEEWSQFDITPGYHKDTDIIAEFNLDYFHNMVKLGVGYIATKGKIIPTASYNDSEFATVSIQPNPVKDFIHLNFSSPFKGIIKIYDVNAVLVSKQQIHQKTTNINISQLETGIYAILITDEFGNHSTKKIIKK